VFLLYYDETASPETTNTTNETILKSWTLPANDYDAIIIESEVRGNISRDTDTAVSFTWRIREGGLTGTIRKEITTRITADNDTGVGTGQITVYPLKVVISGGQSANRQIVVTGQMSSANNSYGLMAYSLRVYGVKKLKLLVAE